MSARWNQTQAELNRASALRALEAMELSAVIRDAIPTIRNRRFAKLASLIRSTPCPFADRRIDNRRARRAGRDYLERATAAYRESIR